MGSVKTINFDRNQKTVPKSNTIILEKLSVAFDSKIKKLDYFVKELASKNEIVLLGTSSLGISQCQHTLLIPKQNKFLCVDQHKVCDLKSSENINVFFWNPAQVSGKIRPPAKSPASLFRVRVQHHKTHNE